eukprot:CAMPEP_0175076296 /NCGR_PEP_ID=MMETSP0052_2-20121109/22628_1 /TAXON_ID=51329 ORGANISM="Polytomella parva, Strain SAG 63-3" /NCGR_SAMPLE_ID=MMETSP0052_2 /ASSEMBLY_ACC=CAM_ASM_000194 /LENGTH=314 /DNA_ID=CAMNT_0016345379 /DNA_START=170 /DNA_END=1111 /DNA_ORIENTATION=-
MSPSRTGLLAFSLAGKSTIKVYDVDSESEVCTSDAPARGEVSHIAWDLTDESSLIVSVGTSLLRWRYVTDKWELLRDFTQRNLVYLFRQSPAKPTLVAVALPEGRVLVLEIPPGSCSSGSPSSSSAAALASPSSTTSAVDGRGLGGLGLGSGLSGLFLGGLLSSSASGSIVREWILNDEGVECTGGTGVIGDSGREGERDGAKGHPNQRQPSQQQPFLQHQQERGSNPKFTSSGSNGGLGDASDLAWDPAHPAGYLLVACARGGMVLLDVEAGEVVAGFAKQPAGSRFVTFVPRQPGNFLVASTRSATLQMWNV